MRYKGRRNEDRAGSDIPPADVNLSPDGSTAEALGSTHQLVSRAESKLVGLHANRSQLRKRIRALHYLLKTLKTMFPPSGSSDPALRQPTHKSAFNRDESFEVETISDRAVTSGTGTNTMMTSPPTVTGVSTELRRACRIALMESDRAQDCEQILQRIHRRESLCIEGFRDPQIAIAQELRNMLADGEVIQKDDTQLWQLNRASGQALSKCNSTRK